MENILYYFSSTGNSLKISRDLAKALQNTKIISIAKAINEDIEYPTMNLGIIFPVYFGALPPIVAEFIRKLDPSQINYIFAVATCNDFPGGALHIVKKILKKKQGKLNAGFVLVMPGNYIPLYEPLSREKQEKRFEIANEKLNSIIEIIVTNKENKLSLFGKLLTFLQKRNDTILQNRDKNFWVDENCNSCEICTKICPVQNVEIIGGKPSWLHKCQQCLACLHWCPQEAIQYSKKTINRARYHHPEITLNNLIKE
jgi:ferredoxin